MDAALQSRRPAAPSRCLLTAAACARAEEVLAGLESGRPGLIAAKAARRKMTYGPNAVATHAARVDPVLWQQLRSARLGTWLLDRLGVAFEVVFAAAIVCVPPLRDVFGTAVPEPAQLVLLIPFPIVVWGTDELWRAWRRRAAQRQPRPSHEN